MLISKLKSFFIRTPHKEKGEGQGPGLLYVNVAQRTDVGRKRFHNEDSVAHIVPTDPVMMVKKGALFIVADGMGGHAAGEVASEIAVNTVCNMYYQVPSEDVPSALVHAVMSANAIIYQRSSENQSQQGMGTTCVAAVLQGTTAYIANVGDSRAYLIRQGQIRQVSQDHSWVAEQVRAGFMTPEQAGMHAMRNMITRSMGFYPTVAVDIFTEQVTEGDILVLCSDGLSGMVSDSEILQIVQQFGPQESVYRLIERANGYGGVDNITVLIARVSRALR
jgi:serine/threonine protein phosphatase PrpC